MLSGQHYTLQLEKLRVTVPLVVAALGVVLATKVRQGSTNEIPAIYAESSYSFKTPEQTAEQFAEQRGFTLNKAGKLAENIEIMTEEVFLELRKLWEKRGMLR
jgi:hypothetical protein